MDTEFDFVIAGSGGGGMTAALAAHHCGLKPLILEKSNYFGGSTALSGGAIWVPNNRLMKKDGINDSFEEAFSYMQETAGSDSPQANQLAYLKYAPEMVQFLERNCGLRFGRMPGYADYYPERKGGNPHSRSLEALPFDGKKLGKILNELNPSLWKLADLFRMTGREYHGIAMMRTTLNGKKTLMKVVLRLITDFLTRKKRLSLGQSLSAMLRYSLLNKEIPLWLNTGVKELRYENGRVSSVLAEQKGKEIEIRVKKGVLIATGGFARNKEMREAYLPKPNSLDWSLANPGNTGDGINMATKLGAKTALMDDAWWGPICVFPDNTPFFLVSERSQPGIIIVNKEGKRFVNEAKPYAEFGHVIQERYKAGEGTAPCYFVFDHRVRKKYGFGLLPAGFTPKKYFESGFIVKADTLEELAQKTGIDSQNLPATVKRFNEMAASGKDSDFGKGNSAYDRHYGDPSIQPNPCLHPLNSPPYYCVKLYPGDIGTKGGVVTDEFGRVIKQDGNIIEGLYATGNTTASVMGHSYPGAGATIGPSMTFGYLSALHASGKLSTP